MLRFALVLGLAGVKPSASQLDAVWGGRSCSACFNAQNALDEKDRLAPNVNAVSYPPCDLISNL